MSTITPTDQQFKAISLVEYWFKSKQNNIPFILGGYAGVGKSTIIPFIIDQLGLSMGEVHFCSFTGKAANVLRKKGMPATTIHSLIYVPYEDSEGKLKFKRNPCLNRALKLLVVDESSTVYTKLKDDLESYGIPIIYIGDCFQLPPVSKDQTNIMSNPNFILTEIHRQAADNPIIQIAHQVRNGQYIKKGKYGDTVLKIGIDHLKDEWLLRASQVICGKNVTRHNLNRQIRRAKGLEYNHPIVGDKLICLKNNNDNGLINGMMGTCNSFDLKGWTLCFENDDDETWNGLEIDPEVFEMSNNIQYRKGVEQFDYGYVITCHKSQGSQFDNVLLFEEMLGTTDEMRRRWLYTGITRAAERIIIVG